MTKISIWVIIMTILWISCDVAGQKKWVIGYYQSWQWKKSPGQLDPENIPYNKLTVINYSFFYPLESGEIVGMDPVADRYILLGESDASSGNMKAGSSLIELAKRQGTKVILSIGGWETSGNFPQVAADSQKRAIFAHWCVNHIHQYGFDGIDVDWEFPGYVRHNGTPQDKYNFTLLLQAVRDSLDLLGMKSGKRYTLSVSLPAAASHLQDMEVQKISDTVDYLNIMTWDLFGPWGKISNHNSALLGPAQAILPVVWMARSDFITINTVCLRKKSTWALHSTVIPIPVVHKFMANRRARIRVSLKKRMAYDMPKSPKKCICSPGNGIRKHRRRTWSVTR